MCSVNRTRVKSDNFEFMLFHIFSWWCVYKYFRIVRLRLRGEGKKREETKAATAAWRSGVVNFDWVTRMNNSWNHNFFMRFFFGIHIFFFCLRRRRFERQQNFFFLSFFSASLSGNVTIRCRTAFAGFPFSIVFVPQPSGRSSNKKRKQRAKLRNS